MFLKLYKKLHEMCTTRIILNNTIIINYFYLTTEVKSFNNNIFYSSKEIQLRNDKLFIPKEIVKLLNYKCNT